MRLIRIIAVLGGVMLFLAACPAEDTDDAPSPDDDAAEEPDDADEAAADVSLLDVEPGDLPDGWELPDTMGHVTNYLVHEWYQNLTAAAEEHADEFGINFGINDANLDLSSSLAAVDDYLAQGIDAMVFTPVDEEASATTITNAVEQVPIVCESSPTDGCLTLVAIDDFDAGEKVGVWAGEYLQEQDITEVKALDVGLPALSTTLARSDGFFAGLESVISDVERIEVDGQGLKDEAVRVAADALTANQDINVIFGINDDSALGGVEAYEAAGLDLDDLLAVGFGCEGNACKSALLEGGPYKVSAGMFPEFQGMMLVRSAIAAFNGMSLPDHTVMPSAPLTADNLSDYYTEEDGEFEINFDAVAELYDAN
jgi:ribose transport system substrate-binding protein